MDETALHNRWMGGVTQRASSFVLPDYATVCQELQRKDIEPNNPKAMMIEPGRRAVFKSEYTEVIV